VKVGSIPGGAIEWLLVKANQIPVPVIDSFSAMMNAKAILAANELKVFDALAGGPLTARELAARIGASEHGTQDLADALCASGYLAREAERVALTASSRKWLVSSSPSYVGHMLEHINDLWGVWLNLEEAIRKGSPPASNYQDWLGNEDYRRILRRHIVGLRDMARFSAPELLRAVRLPAGARRLLDIGGGHGGYSVAFCKKYAGLTATVFDLEATAEIGRQIVERERMSDRVKFEVGNFLTDELGSGYDAALYFNIIHNYSEAENRRVLAKAAAALKPGGRLIIWDMFKEPGGGRDVQPALMALHMLVASGGTSYLVEDVYGWLADAGFERPTRKETRTAPGLSLILTRKP
jgi:SAM-dependent methyltransferase